MDIRAARKAKEEVIAVVESAAEQDISGGSHIDFGAPSAGVTTQNLMQDEVFPTPPSAADFFMESAPEVAAVEPEPTHEFVE